MRRIAFALFVTIICTAPSFAQRVQIRNVAIVETMLDSRSDAENMIKKVEVSEITTEIRRVAVNVLPRNRFNVMTTETVQSMGDAVLAECADENCVITLGTTIGADFIVRGVISTFGQNLTLSVEMFETEYGMLIASADAVRSANVEELLEKASAACREMYKGFLEASAHTAQTIGAPEPVTPPPEQVKPKPERTASDKKPFPLKLTLRVSTAALAVGGIAGGLIYNGMVNSEYDDKFVPAPAGSKEEADAKKQTQDYMSTRDLLYILGGIGLAGFGVTFVF